MPPDFGQLVATVGTATPYTLLVTMLALAYVHERRKVDTLQAKLYRLAVAGLAEKPSVDRAQPR